VILRIRRYTLLSVALVCFVTGFTYGQQPAVVFGSISGEDKQAISNANIKVAGQNDGTTSNKEGKYEIRVPAGKKVTLLVTHVSFLVDSITVNLKPGERKEINIGLKKSTTELESVEIRDQQLRTNSFSRLDPKTMTYIPTINASIEDLIKTMPGVSSRNELSSQYSVRGGNYDENLVFVNDIEIYRPVLIRSGQQEGLSFLNPDLVSGITFSAGGFDAKYGDKMSSVLDIRYKRPTSFAGSFDISLQGANAHVEGTFAKKFSYLLGARYKTNTYFLKGLDTKGNYKPRFFDIQGLLNYEITKKWEVSVMGTFSDNSYKLIPETRETSFGTINEAYKIMIYFDGQEVDLYKNWLGAVTLTYKPIKAVRLRLISSAYQANESETFDISGEYWLGKLEAFQGSSNYGNVTEALGVGAFLDHARNYFDGTVFNIEHRGNYEMNSINLLWGVKYEHEYFHNVMNEWQVEDSAGYSLPRPPDSLGSPNPPHDPLVLSNVITADNSLGSNRYSAFVQNTWTFKNQKNDISLTAGVRAIYDDFNHQFLVNPRANVSFRPHWRKETVFRLAAGYYSQPPTFSELTDLQGQIVTNLKAQTAIAVVGGTDLYFKWWNRPFKFTTEAYYKYLQNLIPYEIDNLKIRYYGNNNAYGYATGIDFRINGEFVKGVESWASLSLMKTMENVDGVWVPRPTDQRVNLSIFFQDYIPNFPTWRVNLTLFYGTGLPFGPPGSPKSEQTRRTPPYRRVDIGLTKLFITENTKFSAKNPLRVFTSMWLSLEVFNLLQISNTISYLWVTDVNGNPYAVPNYLTPRQFNIRWGMTF
jgi:hypothetical protein